MDRGEGAERISQRILSEARSQAEELLAGAAKKSAAVIAAAEKEAAQNKEQILEKAKKEIEEQKKRILGLAQLDARKNMLAAKQELLTEAFQQALQKLINLEEEEYWGYLRQMLLASMQTGAETIILSPRDKARIPHKFWDDLKKELINSGRAGKCFLGPESPEIKGGFILQSEELEINNSFNALLSRQREELESEVAAMLFEEK